jgi:hypothetical protein
MLADRSTPSAIVGYCLEYRSQKFMKEAFRKNRIGSMQAHLPSDHCRIRNTVNRHHLPR